MGLEKTLESPLNSKEIKSVNPKGNQPWVFIGRTDAKAEIGHLMWRTDSLEKTLMLGKTRQEEKGTTEDEMVGWHHHLNGHEFEQTLGGGEGQGSLVGCSPCRWKELDTTEQLNSLYMDYIYTFILRLQLQLINGLEEECIWKIHNSQKIKLRKMWVKETISVFKMTARF